MSARSHSGRISRENRFKDQRQIQGELMAYSESGQVSTSPEIDSRPGDPDASIGLNDPCVRLRGSTPVHAGPDLPGDEGDPSTLVYAGPAPSGRIVVASARDRLARSPERVLARYRLRREVWRAAGGIPAEYTRIMRWLIAVRDQ